MELEDMAASKQVLMNQIICAAVWINSAPSTTQLVGWLVVWLVG